MNEFSLINAYFKSIKPRRKDVIFGIGDDAACLRIPEGTDLLVSTDTLVDGVHFLSDWDAYDIASRAVKVNVSDMAAMAAMPCWVSLALTLPKLDEPWLKRFSQGLADSLHEYQIDLIGGDTTRGPLTITLTIHGQAPSGQVIRRSGAQIGDKILVSGHLGAAALAVSLLDRDNIPLHERTKLMEKLLHPIPRLDLIPILREYATAAIDVSDGLSADLNHILEASQLGATLELNKIPIHPLVHHYQKERAIDFAISGGDDYEICFTVPALKEHSCLSALKTAGMECAVVGVINQHPGMSAKVLTGDVIPLQSRGYSHF